MVSSEIPARGGTSALPASAHVHGGFWAPGLGKLPACWALHGLSPPPPVKYRADAGTLTAVWTGVRQELGRGGVCGDPPLCAPRSPYPTLDTPRNLGNGGPVADLHLGWGKHICSLKSGQAWWLLRSNGGRQQQGQAT